mgnify:CR=1 FL=1
MMKNNRFINEGYWQSVTNHQSTMVSKDESNGGHGKFDKKVLSIIDRWFFNFNLLVIPPNKKA